MPRYGNKANFSCFLTFQTLKCSISQNIHVLLLNVPEKFHYLSPKRSEWLSAGVLTIQAQIVKIPLRSPGKLGIFSSFVPIFPLVPP